MANQIEDIRRRAFEDGEDPLGGAWMRGMWRRNDWLELQSPAMDVVTGAATHAIYDCVPGFKHILSIR